MRTGVNWWNAEKILWYERAAAECSFHRNLSEYILKHLEAGRPVHEAGCGLGHAAEILFHKGIDITASDRDPAAIAQASWRSSLDIFSLRDAYDLPYFPQLLLIFFGCIGKNDNLQRFMKNTERIICILSEHSGQGVKTGRKGSEETERFLDENGIKYTKETFEIPFPQPLLSLSEAERFIERNYGRDYIDRLLPFAEKTDGQYPLMLRNNKKCTLFDIRKEES